MYSVGALHQGKHRKTRHRPNREELECALARVYVARVARASTPELTPGQETRTYTARNGNKRIVRNNSLTLTHTEQRVTSAECHQRQHSLIRA